MGRFVIAVSLAHLFLFPAYVKLGAVQPWQAVDSIFGGGFLWFMLMASAVVAPFLLGGIGLALYSFLPSVKGVKQSLLILVGLVGFLSLINGILIANLSIEQEIHIPIISFIGRHLVSITLIMGWPLLAALIIFISLPELREKAAAFGSRILYILSPLAIFSVMGIAYVFAFAHPVEASEKQVILAQEVLGNIIILLFDALSYNAIFTVEKDVRQGLPNFNRLVDQSLVFHNVSSFSGGTGRNVPIILTGQVYPEGGIVVNAEGEEIIRQDGTLLSEQENLFDVVSDRGYPLTVLGYALRYCTTYVKDKGYCRSTSPSEFNSQPRNFAQAISEVYRLAIVRALPTTVEYKLQIFLGTSSLSSTTGRSLDLQSSVLARIEKPGFIYAHYPIPHPPYISLDTQTGEVRGSSDYFDSVKVADYFLGEIREKLESAGAWEETLLIVIADHNDGYITKDPRTPLIAKLPYMQQRLDHDAALTHEDFFPLFRHWVE